MTERYCKNCGKKIPEGVKYCPFCGKAVDDLEEKQKEPASVSSEYKDKKPHGKKPLTVILIVIVLVAAGSGMITWYFLNHKAQTTSSQMAASVTETAKTQTKRTTATSKTETKKASVLPETSAKTIPTPSYSKDDRMNFAVKNWKTIYLQYLDCINSSDSSFSGMKNVSSDQITAFQERYSLNAKFNFTNQWLQLDKDSYSETDQGNGTYNVAFHTYAYNLCVDQNDGERSDNYVKLSVTMTINPGKGTYTMTYQKPDKNYTFSSDMVDITTN